MPETGDQLVAAGQGCGRTAASANHHIALYVDDDAARSPLRAHRDLSGAVYDDEQALGVAGFVSGAWLEGRGPGQAS